jgi:hypothetical protein
LCLQWTTVLDILEWFLHERGLTYVRLDGSTAVADRLTIVDTFNDPNGGVFAFLLSTRAGGQGLNLTGADTVILHDVDFNPQVCGVSSCSTPLVLRLLFYASCSTPAGDRWLGLLLGAHRGSCGSCSTQQ